MEGRAHHKSLQQRDKVKVEPLEALAEGRRSGPPEIGQPRNESRRND